MKKFFSSSSIYIQISSNFYYRHWSSFSWISPKYPALPRPSHSQSDSLLASERSYDISVNTFQWLLLFFRKHKEIPILTTLCFPWLHLILFSPSHFLHSAPRQLNSSLRAHLNPSWMALSPDSPIVYFSTSSVFC